MSLASLEKAILAELKEVTGNKKLTKNSIQEWSTGEITPHDGEQQAFLPVVRVHVAYKVK